MKRITACAVLTGAMITLGACSTSSDKTASAGMSSGAAAGTLAEPNIASIRASIDAANEKWRNAMLANDVAGALSNYTDDAVVMMPGTPMMSGRTAFEGGFKGMMASMKVNDVQMSTMDVMAGGDLAIETGTFSMTTTAKNAKPMTESGKYLTVWKHQADGSWRIIRDINNPDGAAKAAKK